MSKKLIPLLESLTLYDGDPDSPDDAYYNASYIYDGGENPLPPISRGGGKGGIMSAALLSAFARLKAYRENDTVDNLIARIHMLDSEHVINTNINTDLKVSSTFKIREIRL